MDKNIIIYIYPIVKLQLKIVLTVFKIYDKIIVRGERNMLQDSSKMIAFDADYGTKKELQIIKEDGIYYARYVFFGERLWNMYDDGNEFICKMVDKKDEITNAEIGKYLNTSLENRLLKVKFDDEIKYVNAFIYSDFAQTAVYLREFLNNNINISYCKHCGKPFISNGKSIYCHRFDNERQQPCRVIGALKSYDKNIKEHPEMSEYRKAYKRYIARRNAGKISKDEFQAWAIIAKSAIADYDDGLISYDKLVGIINKWE